MQQDPLQRIESPHIREARETELAMLARLQLYDASQEVHYDPETQEIPLGYTFGYNVHKRPQTDRLRRSHKVHISARLKDSLATAYNTFVAEVDHKAVVAELAPPIFVQRPPPPRWSRANAQSATTRCGTELVYAAVQQA